MEIRDWPEPADMKHEAFHYGDANDHGGILMWVIPASACVWIGLVLFDLAHHPRLFMPHPDSRVLFSDQLVVTHSHQFSVMWVEIPVEGKIRTCAAVIWFCNYFFPVLHCRLEPWISMVRRISLCYLRLGRSLGLLAA